MRKLEFRGIRDIEIFGFSAKRAVKVIFCLSVLGSAYFGLSLVWSAASLAFLPVTFVLGLGWSVLGFVFAPVKFLFSATVIGGLAYGAYRFFTRNQG